jgi:hypothetical protein
LGIFPISDVSRFSRSFEVNPPQPRGVERAVSLARLRAWKPARQPKTGKIKPRFPPPKRSRAKLALALQGARRSEQDASEPDRASEAEDAGRGR